MKGHCAILFYLDTMTHEHTRTHTRTFGFVSARGHTHAMDWTIGSLLSTIGSQLLSSSQDSSCTCSRVPWSSRQQET